MSNPSSVVYVALVHADPVLRAEYRPLDLSRSLYDLFSGCKCNEDQERRCSMALIHPQSPCFITSLDHHEGCPLRVANPWTGSLAFVRQEYGPLIFSKQVGDTPVHMTPHEFAEVMIHCRQNLIESHGELKWGTFKTAADAKAASKMMEQLSAGRPLEPTDPSSRQCSDEELEVMIRRAICLQKQPSAESAEKKSKSKMKKPKKKKVQALPRVVDVRHLLRCTHVSCLNQFFDKSPGEFKLRNEALCNFLGLQHADKLLALASLPDLISTCETAYDMTQDLVERLSATHDFRGRCTGRLSPRENKGLTLNECNSQTYVNSFLCLWTRKDRFSIVSDQYIDLPDGKKHPRGVLMVSLVDQSSGCLLHVYVTQLDHLLPEQRRESLHLLHKMMQKSRICNAIPVLTGDYNTFPDQQGQEMLQQNLLVKGVKMASDDKAHSGSKATFMGKAGMDPKFLPPLKHSPEWGFYRDGPILDGICYDKNDFVVVSSKHSPIPMDPGELMKRALETLHLASDHAAVQAVLLFKNPVL